MAMNDSNAPGTGILGAIRGALGLFNKINKTDSINEDSNPTPEDEYKGSLDDEQIIGLISTWKREYKAYYSDIDTSNNISYAYWIGKQQFDDADQLNGSAPLVDNRIFKAMETFIPIATRSNPDPLVQADPSEIGSELAEDIKNALVHEADRQKLRKLLKGMLRHWMIYRIGVLKMSYNLVTQQIETTVVNPKRMLFDPHGHIDVSGFFTGDYIGEKKRALVSELIELFPQHREILLEKGGGKKGTLVDYMEWWYRDTDLFYTIDDTVLWKGRNPHWNYDMEATPANEEAGLPEVPKQEGQNHFDSPKAPYIFLSIFSTGLGPHDETSLIIQNVGLQDMINRRYRQIDDNVRKMNNGIVVSNVFTEAQASQAASTLAKGGAIRVPMGDVKEAVMRLPAPPIPAEVFDMMRDGRDELDGIFGTSGSTPEGVESQQTVRGKILINQLDASRIGGGVTEYIEQAADTWYNMTTQFMFVHFTDEHYYIAAGSTGGQSLIEIKNTQFLLTKTLSITVKEGSLIPKDPLTQRNEAIDLWSAGAIDPKSFYKKLDFADPEQATQDLMLWQMFQKGQVPPQAYLPSFAVPGAPAGPMGQPPQVGGPAVNDIGQQQPQPAPPEPSQEGVQTQEHQLIESVPA